MGGCESICISVCWLLFSDSASPVTEVKGQYLLFTEELFCLGREQCEDLLAFGKGIDCVSFVVVWNSRHTWTFFAQNMYNNISRLGGKGLFQNSEPKIDVLLNLIAFLDPELDQQCYRSSMLFCLAVVLVAIWALTMVNLLHVQRKKLFPTRRHFPAYRGISTVA